MSMNNANYTGCGARGRGGIDLSGLRAEVQRLSGEVDRLSVVGGGAGDNTNNGAQEAVELTQIRPLEPA